MSVTMNERALDTILDDTSMWKAAKEIREWLVQISGLCRRLNEDPNPFYESTLDGLVLVEYYGGPSSVGTPLGGWACTGGGVCNGDWKEKAIERLGLVLLEPEIRNEQGCYGPVWGITKDLEGNPLPKPQWSLSSIGFGLVSDSPLAIQNVSVAELSSRLYALTDTPYISPQLPYIYEDLAYKYKKAKWKHIKLTLGFVAVFDRVDPYWKLVPLYSLQDIENTGFKIEGFSLSSRYYSVQGEKDEILCVLESAYFALDTTLTGWCCTKIVNNNIVTAEELDLIEKLLVPHECSVKHLRDSLKLS